MANDPQYTFEIRKSEKNGQYYWHLVSSNGAKIAWSGETFVEKAGCLKSLELVKAQAGGAGITDYSEEGSATVMDLGQRVRALIGSKPGKS